MKTQILGFRKGGFMKYEINEGTLAILPIDSEKSKVFEDQKEYIIDENPYQILDESCKYFGSSYQGRKEGAKSILGDGYKIPIVVEDGRNIIFFPTISPFDKECIWLSSKNIQGIEEIDDVTSRIIFNNSRKIEIPISYRSLENQLFRATRLESVVRNRKINKNMQN